MLIFVGVSIDDTPRYAVRKSGPGPGRGKSHRYVSESRPTRMPKFAYTAPQFSRATTTCARCTRKQHNRRRRSKRAEQEDADRRCSSELAAGADTDSRQRHLRQARQRGGPEQRASRLELARRGHGDERACAAGAAAAGGGGEGNGRVGSLCAARGARKSRRGEGLCDGSCHACRRTGQCRAKTSHPFPPRLRRTGRPRRDRPRRRKRRVSRGERRGHVATRRSIPTAATRAQGRRLLEEHAID